MPKEIRYLLFSSEEVLAALMQEVAEATHGVGLDGVSFSLQMAQTPQGGVALRASRRLRDGTMRPARALEGADVLALLLRLCKRSRVPLPLRGLRAISVLTESVRTDFLL